MTDQQFLMWIHDRLVYVHKESELMDYMHKLRGVIADMDPAKTGPNIARMDTDANDLRNRVWSPPTPKSSPLARFPCLWRGWRKDAK